LSLEKLNVNDSVFVEDAPKVKMLLEPPPPGLAVLPGSGNLNLGFPCSGVTTADADPSVLGVAPNSAFDACFGVFTSEVLPMPVPETLEGELLDEAGVVRRTGVDMGVFNILLVDPGVLVCWELAALNRLEEVGFTVSTSEEPTPTPSTGAGTSEVEASLLDDRPPVFPNLRSGFDLRLGEVCMFAPNVLPSKTFEVPATLKGFDVSPMVPRTDVDG